MAIGTAAWRQEKLSTFCEERSALVRFALELQALLDRVKGKLRSCYSDSELDSSDDDDDVETWMKDVETFLEEEQVRLVGTDMLRLNVCMIDL